MPSVSSVDFTLQATNEATLPITDLTFRRGYGSFDFLYVVDGIPMFIDDHLVRFERSSQLLGVGPMPNRERLKAHVHELIDANGGGTFGLQMFLTAGDPLDGFTPQDARFVALTVPAATPTPDAFDTGYRLITHRHQRDLPEAKTTNYFTAVRLAPKMREADANDVLYHDGERVLEATRCSFFLVDASGAFVTPGRDILPGVTRLNTLRALRHAGHQVAERDVALSELRSAREAFVTSTTKGVMPVLAIDGEAIGDGRPGPQTREAHALLKRHRADWARNYTAP
jgi:branched-subunit amino acid aminotransferase/4-amino-4-deoxychorismate lyase